MKTTTLAFATAALLGGLTLGIGSASAGSTGPISVQSGNVPTSYVAMMSKRKMMMMKRNKMMRRKMMMKKKMM